MTVLTVPKVRAIIKDYYTSASPGVPVVSKTAAYTATGGDGIILCDASDAAFTITLPTSSEAKNRVYIIKKTDSGPNAVTVDGNASETIDGATTAVITTQYESISIICDGSNWHLT